MEGEYTRPPLDPPLWTSPRPDATFLRMSIRQTLMIACVAALCGCATAGAGGQAKPPPLPESSQAAPAAQNTFTLIRVSDSKWELYVENTNYARFINNFSWAAPAGLTVRSISNIQGGQCTLSENVLQALGGDCAGVLLYLRRWRHDDRLSR